LLAESSLASGLRPGQLEVLAGRMQVRSVSAGEEVLSRDDASAPLLVILSGEAEVRGMFGQGVSKLKAGSLVGEIAFLDHGPRTADVVALSDVLIGVFQDDLIAWLNQEHPDVTAQILLNLSQVLCSKLRWAQRMIDADDASTPWPDR
jgi:CRP-like cAMP-binding protein